MSLSVYIRKAIEDGKIIFPGKYCAHCSDHAKNEPLKCLECLRRSKSAHSFSSQYMNDPIDSESVEFKTSWLIKTPFTRSETEQLDKTSGILSIDPAFGLKTINDYAGITVSKILPGNHVYVLEAIQKRLSVPNLINLVFDLRKTYSVNKVLLETTSAQLILLTPFKNEMVKRKDFFQIEEVGRSTIETKAMRIRGMIDFYANGFVHHRPGLTDLEYQMIQFPRNTHDDIIDALAHQVPYWKKGHTKPQAPNKSPYGSLNWWKKQKGHTHKDKWDNLFGDLLK